MNSDSISNNPGRDIHISDIFSLFFQGDSGGPLMCPSESGEKTMHGIVSWGHVPCGLEQYPGVFTRTAHFRDWIDEHKQMFYQFQIISDYEIDIENKILQINHIFFLTENFFRDIELYCINVFLKLRLFE